MMNFCGDCFVKEGQLHKESCDMERCPKCKGQLLSCSCYEFNPEKYNKIPILDEDREPFFEKIFCCGRCGKIMPDMKMVSDKEWEFICGVTYPLDCILCERCMKFIKEKREKNGLD